MHFTHYLACALHTLACASPTLPCLTYHTTVLCTSHTAVPVHFTHACAPHTLPCCLCPSHTTVHYVVYQPLSQPQITHLSMLTCLARHCDTPKLRLPESLGCDQPPQMSTWHINKPQWHTQAQTARYLNAINGYSHARPQGSPAESSVPPSVCWPPVQKRAVIQQNLEPAGPAGGQALHLNAHGMR